MTNVLVDASDEQRDQSSAIVAGAGDAATDASPAPAVVVTPTSVSFADRVWQGGVGDWYDVTKWTTTTADPNDYPLPGDSATISSGTAMLLGTEAKDGGTFDTNDVTLGSAASSATLDFVQARVDPLFKITTAGNAEVLSTGTSKFGGTLTAAGGSTLTLASEASGADAGSLVFNQAGLTFSGNQTVAISGNVTFEAHTGNVVEAQNGTAPEQNDDAYLSLPGAVVNNGSITTIQQYVEIAGSLSGTGTYNLRFETTLNAEGAVSSGQTIAFGQGDSRLDIGNVAAFAGKITNFSAGNFIDLTNVAYNPRFGADASYDAASQTLTVTNDFGGTLAQLHNVQATQGTLFAESDGGNGIIVGYADSPSSPSSIDLSGADRAMHGDIARTLDVPGTATPIDGSGIKIGIISDSFNLTGTADGNAAAGYLPANPDGSSAVTILKEGPAGGSDEGQAMAELAHQVAPGAQLYFAEGIKTESDFADSIAKLQAAGCQIIVDDIGYYAEARDQIVGPLPDAVNGALSAGVNYFTSAGNDRHNFLEQGFTPSSATLADGTAVKANVFSNGTVYEPIRIRGGASIEVQWSAPYTGADGTGAPNALQAKLFDASGNLVASSQQVVDDNGIATADADLFVPAASNYGTYNLAIYETDGVAPPSDFSFIISGAGHSAIYDPAAGQGAGNIIGKDLIPGVNTVGAVFYGDSRAFGQTPSSEYFSSYGPGELTYDSQGQPLATPVTLGKPDFAAPDGVTTSLSPFQPFFGTSAAAPNAAAVGALMLQADGRLINKQISYLLKASAIPFGNATQGGAGLIQADTAVSGAITAATTPIWTGQANSSSWSDAANWSDNRVPGANDNVTIGNGIGALAGAYSVVYNLAAGQIGSLVVDGASTLAAAATPTLSIVAGASLSALSFSVGTGFLDLAGGLAIEGGAASTGAILLSGTSTNEAVLTLSSLAQSQFNGVLDDFGAGDALDLENLRSAVASYADGKLVVSGVDATSGQATTKTFTLADPAATTYYAHDDGHAGTRVDTVACFVTGTSIRTVRGDVAVDDLRIGDLVVTASGAERPIKWIGHRAYAGRFANSNPDVLPICFTAGSLGDAVPARDLWVSPKHAMFLDGALFPAEALVNGVSVVKAEHVDSVAYWHVELESHDVLIAEGALSESFVDDNSRGMFHNAHTFARMYPDAPSLAAAVYCAPRIEDGHRLEAVRRTIAARAGLEADVPDCGALDGYVEGMDSGAVRGWARSVLNPAMPVCLDLVIDGHFVGQALANRRRADLEAAGYGRHAFEIAVPVGAEGKRIEVRRSADGAKLKLVLDRAA